MLKRCGRFTLRRWAVFQSDVATLLDLMQQLGVVPPQGRQRWDNDRRVGRRGDGRSQLGVRAGAPRRLRRSWPVVRHSAASQA